MIRSRAGPLCEQSIDGPVAELDDRQPEPRHDTPISFHLESCRQMHVRSPWAQSRARLCLSQVRPERIVSSRDMGIAPRRHQHWDSIVVLRLGNRATTCVLFQPKPNAF